MKNSFINEQPCLNFAFNGSITFVLNQPGIPANHCLIEFQLSLITTTNVAIAATTPATTPVTNAGAPKIIAPTAVIATPNTISPSLAQVNPFFNILRKLVTAKSAPDIVATIPDIIVATGPIVAANASLNVPAPPIANAIAFAIPASKPPSAISPPVSNIFKPLIAIGTLATAFINAALIALIKLNPKTTFLSSLRVTNPIIIATLSKSNSLRKSLTPLKISFQLRFLSTSTIVSLMPCAQVFIVFASDLKSNVWKNLFTPAAIDLPNSLNSNVCPNDNAAYIAVFNAPAIVLPTALNNSGDIRPFRKSANPLPKFLAPLYTFFQSILLRVLVNDLPIKSPNL